MRALNASDHFSGGGGFGGGMMRAAEEFYIDKDRAIAVGIGMAAIMLFPKTKIYNPDVSGAEDLKGDILRHRGDLKTGEPTEGANVGTLLEQAEFELKHGDPEVSG